MGLSVGSLSSYINWVNNIPMLTLEQEQEYAARLQESGDLDAAKELIMSHLRLVVRMARGYSGYGLSQEDLIQEGNIGLMKAVKRFNPDKGVRLVSFAIHWIRAEMHEFILRNWKVVKVATTKAQRKLFFNLRKASQRIGWLSRDEVTTIAETLSVSETDVRQMEQRMSAHDVPFDARDEELDNPDHCQVAPSLTLEDHRYNPETLAANSEIASQSTQALYAALATLDERSRDIVESRWLSHDKKTLHELADTFSISAERVRQLEKIAMNKVKMHVSQDLNLEP